MHARYHSPSLAEVTCAAALAAAGHLTRLDCLVLEDISLGAVAAGDLASLCRCVRGVEAVYLESVRGDLDPVLSNISCTWLTLDSMTLTTADTRSLVAALDRGVRHLDLGGNVGVTLDMEALAGYRGGGECERVQLLGPGHMTESYRGLVAAWAKDIGWRLLAGWAAADYWIEISRSG